MNEIVLIGAGGHARSMADSIERAGAYRIKGFVDSRMDARLGRYARIGSDDDLLAIRATGVEDAAICLGYLGHGRKRQDLFDMVKRMGFRLPTIVDPSAVLASDVEVGEGAFIGKAAIVNSAAMIGAMAIVNSGAVVEHDCIVGDFSHIAINASLCGECHVADAVLVGAGAVVLQGISIGSGAIVGAGSVVLSDVQAGLKVVGVYGG